MALDLTSMLDADFTWTTNPAGFDLVLVQGGVTYNVDVPTGTYKLFLGSSTTSFLRVLNAAIATAGANGAFKLVYTTSPSPGVIPNVGAHIYWNSTTASNNTYYTELAALFGGMTGGSAVNHEWSTYAPRHCAFLGDVHGGCWKPSTPGGFEKTSGGRVYGFRAGLTTHTREFTSGFIPGDASMMNTLCDPATPMWPVKTYLGAINPTSATIRQWSWLDFLAQSANAQVGFAHGNLAELLAEQPSGAYVEEYYLGYLDVGIYEEPAFTTQFDPWDAYKQLGWGFVLPTTSQVSTRA